MHRNSYSNLCLIHAGVAILLCTDDTNISVWSGSIDTAVRKLNSAICLLGLWFWKWRTKINTTKMHNYFVFQMTAIVVAILNEHIIYC
jgi:hypothetical protein